MAGAGLCRLPGAILVMLVNDRNEGCAPCPSSRNGRVYFQIRVDSTIASTTIVFMNIHIHFMFFQVIKLNSLRYKDLLLRIYFSFFLNLT